MVQFHIYGSTSKGLLDFAMLLRVGYCFICGATCYVPPVPEISGKLTNRDRRHLGNIRILGRHGISHPGLTWHYNANLNSMTCLGYSCPIYEEFNPNRPNSCLSVHRSCYAVLLERIERTEGTAGSTDLMQRIAPFADSRGIIMLPRPKDAKTKTKLNSTSSRILSENDMTQDRDMNVRMPWLACDPTDLPAVALPRNYGGGISNGPRHLAGRVKSKQSSTRMLSNHRGAPPPLLLQRGIGVGVEDSDDDDYMCSTIPAQLLTPPTSPVDGDDMQPHFCSPSSPTTMLPPNTMAKRKPSVLLSLPPHVLLNIVSRLHLPSLLTLSHTCSALRKYLSPDSKVWSAMSRSTLSFTPPFLYNQQFAEFYMRVRGNSRLENQVLLQRERVEKTVSYIMYSQKASTTPKSIGYY